jgi:hypothetical protein
MAIVLLSEISSARAAETIERARAPRYPAGERTAENDAWI